ncbi:hypothetical protein [Roseibium sp.]|uniref:hypothetical protein n=1 Tax=Roseibium sp. TaxID=1936156 RepID=UPI003296DFF6
MIVLEELWNDLFSTAITPLEKRLMEGVADYIDDSEPVLLLAALQVHMLTKVLLQDPASPFVIARKLTPGVEKLTATLDVIRQQAGSLELHLNQLRADAVFTRNTLQLARADAKERRKIPPAVLKLDENTGHPEWEHTLAPNALRKIYLASTFSSLIGGSVAASLVVLFSH